jgi:predicted Rossmann fold nucleotide-binding protein DprA/Smf involved in DNA uptake
VTAAVDVLMALGLDPATERTGDPQLGADATRLLAAVRRAPATAERLATRLGLDAGRVGAALVDLELERLVVRERDGTVAPA